SAGLHEGSRRDFLRRHGTEAAAAARGSAKTRKRFVARLLSRVADTRNLRSSWTYLATGDGQAPGLDGLHFHDLEDREVWALVRTLHDAITHDTYRPAPDRKKTIPKASGKGMRTLMIPSVVDRLVQRAVVQATQVFLDAFLDEHCLGFRPNADVNKALALAEGLIVRNGSWTLV